MILLLNVIVKFLSYSNLLPVKVVAASTAPFQICTFSAFSPTNTFPRYHVQTMYYVLELIHLSFSTVCNKTKGTKCSAPRNCNIKLKKTIMGWKFLPQILIISIRFLSRVCVIKIPSPSINKIIVRIAIKCCFKP